MARFIAIHNVPGITEEDFRDKLNAVRKWRPDRRTTILKVYGDLEKRPPGFRVRGGGAVPLRGLD